jgi:transcriptional regulator with XRE-family HTH domain
MKTLLKKAREQKGLKTREVAQLLDIDQALISKFENGLRLPTWNQISKLASLFEIDSESLKITWIKEKIKNDFGTETVVLKAISEILKENNYISTTSNEPKIDSILEEMERLKDKLQQLR